MTNDWNSIGKITLSEGCLIPPPTLPPHPGLYRLTFDDGSLYIGEANDIRRRIGDYLVYYPSVAIESEFRINKKLLSSIKGTEVSVLVGDMFKEHSPRCIREHAEIKAAKKEHVVLNGGRIEERIAFYISEIARLNKILEFKNQLNGVMHE